MKNKKNIYILLPAVILVWGLVGYRIFSVVQPSNNTSGQVRVTAFKPKVVEETTPFTIRANYRDPFLGSLAQKKSTKKKAVSVAYKKLKIPFPTITYKGMVAGEGNNRVFLITINGAQFFFKKRATHKEVKLLRGNHKEIVVQFKGQQQTVAIPK